MRRMVDADVCKCLGVALMQEDKVSRNSLAHVKQSSQVLDRRISNMCLLLVTNAARHTLTP